MTTKAELEKQIEDLKKVIKKEESRPTGHTISNCAIDMSKPDEAKLAVANAVAEGMKALQSLGGDSYGLYFEANDK